MSDDVELTRSIRGFNRGPEIPGNYGGGITAYESSGDTPCLWVSVREADDLTAGHLHKNAPEHFPDPTYHEAATLLELPDVERLEATLRELRKRHFLRHYVATIADLAAEGWRLNELIDQAEVWSGPDTRPFWQVLVSNYPVTAPDVSVSVHPESEEQAVRLGQAIRAAIEAVLAT